MAKTKSLYDVHPSLSMIQKWEAELPEKTGRSLDQWAEHVRDYGPADEVELPQHGTITNYTIITPVQYPGQTETEPFARVHVWLDDTDVVLGYQPLLDTANDDVRIGMRVSAVWASDAELNQGKRAADFDAADAALAEDVPVLPLFQRPLLVVHQTTLHGVVANGALMGAFWNLADWWKDVS